MPRIAHLHPSDLHGLSRLVIDGVIGTTDLVEQLHQTIARVALPVGKAVETPTRGVTGIVYRSVNGVTRAIGSGTHFAFQQIVPRLGQHQSSPQRERLLAVINGVLGDHLEASDNPLAIYMNLRSHGQVVSLDPEALAIQFQQPGGRLLITIHGLCMNDLQWASGAPNGAPGLPDWLSTQLGYLPLHLHYNTGRHISANGRDLAVLLELLVSSWPEPVEEICLLGHSMGGLVARSACHYAEEAGHAWPTRLRKLFMLGSPHHGAPLERIGNKVDRMLAISPYSAPFTRLGRIRSAGITDLRHGNLLDEDWNDGDGHVEPEDRRQPVRHLDHVDYHAIAATTDARPNSRRSRWIGDGLVPVTSALGHHPDPDRHLPILPAHQLIVPSTTHLGLLHHAEVQATIERWLR